MAISLDFSEEDTIKLKDKFPEGLLVPTNTSARKMMFRSDKDSYTDNDQEITTSIEE